jgi:heme oxygenase (biliverdin-producing, ferredoxin)
MSKSGMAGLPPAFSLRLRESTREAHDRAESQEFIQRLLDGSLHGRAVTALMRALMPVYVELERQLARFAEDPSVVLFDHRALDRAERLHADLVAAGIGAQGTPSPAVRHYVEVIEASAQSPQRLLAHHYTRYLGDLAGGQVISRLVQRHYDIASERLSYYDFSELGDTHHYRRTYRALLDLVPWSPSEQAEFIAECEVGYDANALLFAELARDSWLESR